MAIAILGWGSLLWDVDAAFSSRHGAWALEGPVLPLEFCRISQKRGGALTLVVDEDHGSLCPVAFAVSQRAELGDSIEDLRRREETVQRNIGVYSANRRRINARSADILETVEAWAPKNNFDAVIWTDLASNFSERTGRPFSMENALHYLSTLDRNHLMQAEEYVRQAPSFVQTPFRQYLAEHR